jgi:hypothetical protein
LFPDLQFLFELRCPSDVGQHCSLGIDSRQTVGTSLQYKSCIRTHLLVALGCFA